MEERNIDLYIYVEGKKFLYHAKAKRKKIEDEKLFLETSPNFVKYALIGKTVYLGYKTFILPVRIIGKAENEVIFSLPDLKPKESIGDRETVRALTSEEHPVEINLLIGDHPYYYNAHDVSEGGFAIIVKDEEIIDELAGKQVSFRMNLPVERVKVEGTAYVVNVVERPDGRYKIGFEMDVEDSDRVKLRFYIYSRVREMLMEG